MKKQPNILLITSDQQHWNTLGFRNKEISTPNLDRLAREGTVFDRAYCPNPTCNPAGYRLQSPYSLLMKYIWAELGKEPLCMPRISGA